LDPQEIVAWSLLLGGVAYATVSAVISYHRQSRDGRKDASDESRRRL